MNATARETPGTDLTETVVYELNQESGLDRPTGSSEMPKLTPQPQGHHRYTYSSGARPLDGYTIKRAIGRGGFGEVYYATSDSGKEVALKLILQNLEVERRGVVQCMNLKCPNLLAIHDLKSNDAGDAFVVMEYVAGPSLANVLAQHPKGLPLAEVRTWLKGLVEGVAYLHDHGIVHRDLKPANMFLEEGIVKIGDYGLAKLITPSHGTEHSESIGTCHYMAPEIASGKYHKPIDVYAIGVILYEMLTGRVPFEGETVGEVLMKHLTARPDLSKLPEPYKSIVGRALSKDPGHRPGRLYDLLPPEDAPRSPGVRFIGDGKVAAAAPETKDAKDDILRIPAEEPVFYIGPETRPPRTRPTINDRLRARWAAMQRPQPRPQQTPPQVRPVAQRQARRPVLQQILRQAPPPPPEPPPLPSGRVRVAELASSLLWSTPLIGLLAIPAGALLGINISREPQQFAYLSGLALLGTWGVLVPSKALEGHSIEPTIKRLLFLGVGVLLGVIGLLFGQWVHLGQLPLWTSKDFGPAFTPVASLLDGQQEPLRYMSYFGLLFLANGWWKLTARDRKSRFRLWPTLVATLIGAALFPFWPYNQPYGIAVVALIAIVSQLVSPWSEAAATYARYKKSRKIA
jgi:serine/threonine protein kinase